MAHLLLTGANGYLGSAVAARLDALGIAWEALACRLEQIEPDSLSHTHVIHCAGAPLRRRPDDWQQGNVEGMAHLLAGMCNVARIVFTSSRSVYGAPFPLPSESEVQRAGVSALNGIAAANDIATALLPESSPLSTNVGYGGSKLAAETLLRASHHLGVCCRLTTLFGAAPQGSCASLPNSAMQAFREGKTVRLLAADTVVDYLLVTDAARLLVDIALRADITAPIVNLAGPVRSLHGLIKTLAAACTTASSPAPRIAYDFPTRQAWPCLDTGLLATLFPDFRHGDDRDAARAFDPSGG